MTEFVFLFGFLSVFVSILQTFWLIDLLICIVVGMLFCFVCMYGLSGSLILIIMMLIYIGVILLLIFLVGFLLDVSLDRNNSVSSDNFLIFIFIVLCFANSDSNYSWSFISSSLWNFEHMASSSLLESTFLWSSLFIFLVFDLMLVGLMLFTILLGVLVALNIRVY